jgi:hypothetical protein
MYEERVNALGWQMKQELAAAIASDQVFRPAASDTELIECFKVGYAADAFNVVRNSLLFLQVMALMRLWDDIGKDVHSILTLDDLLSKSDLVEE